MSRLHFVAKLAKRPHFLIGRHTGHDVACETADDVGLLGLQGELLDHQSDDRGECVAVVEAKGRFAMASAAQVHRLVQPHLLSVLLPPKSHRRVVSIRGGLMKRVLCSAQHRVLRGDDFPGEISQPCLRRFHGSFRFLFGSLLDLFQLIDARALEVTFARRGINGLRREAILHRQPFGHQFLKQRAVQ